MKPTAYDGTSTSGTQPQKQYNRNGDGWYIRDIGCWQKSRSHYAALSLHMIKLAFWKMSNVKLSAYFFNSMNTTGPHAKRAVISTKRFKWWYYFTFSAPNQRFTSCIGTLIFLMNEILIRQYLRWEYIRKACVWMVLIPNENRRFILWTNLYRHYLYQ